MEVVDNVYFSFKDFIYDDVAVAPTSMFDYDVAHSRISRNQPSSTECSAQFGCFEFNEADVRLSVIAAVLRCVPKPDFI